MGVVKIFTPDNRLAGTIGGPNDPTIASMAQRAGERVAALGEVIRQKVRRDCQLISALAEGPEEAVFAAADQIGAAALSVCETAGAARLDDIGEAARGVHAMIDGLRQAGIWHGEALDLHIAALRLLSAVHPPEADEARQMLTRLKAMRQWAGLSV